MNHRRPRLAIAAQITLLLLACHSSTPAMRAYLLESSTGADLLKGTTVHLRFGDGQISLQADCNSMAGAYTLEGDRVVVSALMQTEMGCDAEGTAHDAFPRKVLPLEAALQREDRAPDVRGRLGPLDLRRPRARRSGSPAARHGLGDRPVRRWRDRDGPAGHRSATPDVCDGRDGVRHAPPRCDRGQLGAVSAQHPLRSPQADFHGPARRRLGARRSRARTGPFSNERHRGDQRSRPTLGFQAPGLLVTLEPCCCCRSATRTASSAACRGSASASWPCAWRCRSTRARSHPASSGARAS